MLRAVNRDLRGYPADLAGSALAELARSLARTYDDGDDRAAAQLRGTLRDLRAEHRAARATPPAPTSAAGDPESDPEPAERGAADAARLDEIKANRAIRRDAARRSGSVGRPAAPDMDRSEPESAT
jgi:hypothetical protein